MRHDNELEIFFPFSGHMNSAKSHGTKKIRIKRESNFRGMSKALRLRSNLSRCSKICEFENISNIKKN